MLEDISKIRLRDLEIFEEVARARSIREVSRRINSTSGQVSKSIQNLERLVGTKLFRRSASGVLLTNQGAELQVIVQDLLANGERIESLVSQRGKAKALKVVAIAGTSFLNTHFTAPIACGYAQKNESVNFRFLDLPPDQIIAVGFRGGFDLAVHFGPLSWPSTWSTNRLGKSRWALVAKANHPLPKRPSLKQILEYPFVVPTYWTTEGLVRGNDQFPIPQTKRKAGHEAATADAAIPIVLGSEQLAYVPSLITLPRIEAGQLREIRCGEISPVEKDVYLSAKSDSVSAAVFRGLTEMMTERLSSV